MPRQVGPIEYDDGATLLTKERVGVSGKPGYKIHIRQLLVTFWPSKFSSIELYIVR